MRLTQGPLVSGWPLVDLRPALQSSEGRTSAEAKVPEKGQALRREGPRAEREGSASRLGERLCGGSWGS